MCTDDLAFDSSGVPSELPSSEGGPAQGPRPAPPADLRSRILAEAMRIFAERGFAGTSMREVVGGAQCTKPALYYHFKSKEGLFLEVIRTETTAVTEILERSLRTSGSARERIASGIRLFFEHLRQHPQGMAVLFRAELEADEDQPAFDFRGLRELHIGMCKQVVEDGIRRGEIRKTVDPEDVVLALVGMVDFRSRLYVSNQFSISEQAVDRMVSIFFDGVGS